MTIPMPYNPTAHLFTDDSLIVYATGEITGTVDTIQVQTALNACPPGGVVQVAGRLYTNRPLVFPAYPVSLQGVGLGPMQGLAGTPGTGSVIMPVGRYWSQGAAPFNAVIVGDTAPRQDVSDLFIDASLANANSGAAGAVTVTDLEGIDFSTGGNGGHSLHRVSTWYTPSWGVYAATGLGWKADTVVCQFAGLAVSTQHLIGGTTGGYFCNITDGYHANVHAQNNTGSGIVLRGGDHRLIGCRADLSSMRGYDVASANAGSSLGYGVIFSGCGSQSNQQVGFYLAGASNANTYGPYQMAGCNSTSDGQGGTFAAIQFSGRVTGSVTDTTISGNGVFPAFGVRTAALAGNVPDLVTVDGGMWQVGTSFISDAGPATKLHVGTRLWGVTGAINGTAGTTVFTRVTNPNAIVAPAVPATGVAQANANDRQVVVVVTGGTVTGIAVNGVTTGLTSGSVTVPSGGTITLTYSVAPTWVWYG